jgi:4-hydroxy-2-oxoheptanedioate aldolase
MRLTARPEWQENVRIGLHWHIGTFSEEMRLMFTRSMRLKERFHRDEVTVGAWLSMTSSQVAEIMTGTGFDWLLIDMEHAPFTLDSLETILMAFNGRETVPIVRVPWNDRVIIKQVLDLGAEGILIPYVCSVEEARQAVAACKYPPEGIRGFGPRRASDYYREVDEYVRTANEGVIVFVQIEHIQAVESVQQILAVPGIDGVFLGPQDLSASLRLLGHPDHPRVLEAIERVIAEARRTGIPAGIPRDVDAVDDQLEWVSRGCRLVIAGEDHSFLRRTATRTLAEFRKHLPA